MAISTCIKCGNTFFEIHETPVTGATYRHYFIQCSRCGGVVGVQEYFNVGALLKNLEKAIIKIATAVNVHVDLDS